MTTPQSGIFALGTASHAYLELDLLADRSGVELVDAIAALREPRTTMGGVNLVAGFRPEPRSAIAALTGVASVADETSSWPYQHDRDLTGFIDGTENPSLIDAPEFALIAGGERGAGGTILLLQKWAHDVKAWESLPVERQEAVMGRTKLDSVELEDKTPRSHVGSTDQDRLGKIFRRNMPYGTVMDHGTMFVGFSSDRRRLSDMLENMAGLATGVRDELTLYTHPLSGAYYFVPSTESLRSRVPPEE
jgi:porphyrinogen peroxidase